MPFDITSILLAVIIIQLLLLAIFLFSQDKGRKQSHLLLGLFFLSLCLNLADGLLLYQKFYLRYPSVALWGTGCTLLLGPFLYLYTRSALFKDFFFSPKMLLHFIPFILLELVSLIAYWSLSHDEKIRLLQQLTNRQVHGFFDGVSALIFLHFFIYQFFAWQLIKRYQAIAASRFSDLQKNNVNWLKTLQVAFLLFFFLGLMKTFIYLTSFADFYYVVFFVLVTLLFVFVNRVVLKALNNPAMFTSLEENDTTGTGTPQPGIKYGGSAITGNEKELLRNKILDHMAGKRPYLDADLSLDELAKQLQLKPRILSQLINESIGQSFFDFVNNYRINEAMKMLDNPEDPKITVLEVLYAVGFNSKSSFNTIFKKQTGLTPSEYKRVSMQKRSETGTA
jgi:AraC-like DNA-binding protein